MKTNNNFFLLSPTSSSSYSKNGIVLLSLSLLFATTFILLSNETTGAAYSRRQAMVLTTTNKERQVGSSKRTISKTSYIDQKMTHGCYVVTQDTTPNFSLRNISDLFNLNCSRREPSAIIIGTKKSGTTTLKNFLSFHPEIAFAQRELKFINNNRLATVQDYQAVMPYSTPNQVPMEKTPGYFIRLATAKRLKSLLPRTKLIVILRNPVKRAISDYVHMRYVDARTDGGAKLIRKGLMEKMTPRYEILDSFEESVLFPNGSVKDYNCLIDSGIYAKYFRQWLHLFPSEQFLILDGESFVKDPTLAIREVETFLGVGHYFSQENFYYDKQKGFFCLKKPLNTCMSKNKGRPHPEVNERVITQLTKYFNPHNKELELLLNMTFSWS